MKYVFEAFKGRFNIGTSSSSTGSASVGEIEPDNTVGTTEDNTVTKEEEATATAGVSPEVPISTLTETQPEAATPEALTNKAVTESTNAEPQVPTVDTVLV